MMKHNYQNNSLYTHRADPALAAIVQRIEGKHDRFCTDYLGKPEEENPSWVHLEAWRNPTSSQWQVDRYSLVPGTDVIKKEIELNPGLCFFDALHYCARFQRIQEDLGKEVIEVSGLISLPHYKDEALSSGQAIDEDGEIHPCAFGRVLTEGFFSKQALRTAEITEFLKIAEFSPPASLSGDLVNNILKTSVLPVENQDMMAQSFHKRELINKLKMVIVTGNNLISLMSHAVDVKYQSGFKRAFGYADKNFTKTMTILGEVITGGTISTVNYLRGASERYSTVRPCIVAREKFRRAVLNLPDGTEKTIAQDFDQAAGFVLHIEHAAAIYTLCKEQNKPAIAFQAGLPHIEKAGKINQLGETDISRMKAEYMHGGIKSGQYIDQIKTAWGKEEQVESYDLRRNRPQSITTFPKNPEGLHTMLMNKIEALEQNKLTP